MRPGAGEPEWPGTEAGLKKQNTKTRMKRGLDKALMTTPIK
jgi:hypothetical protein